MKISMRTTMPKSLILVLFSALPLTTVSAQDSVRFEWKWKQGDVAKYRFIQEIKQTMSGPIPMNVNLRAESVLNLKVKDAAASGRSSIEMTFESVKMNGDTAQGKIQFDSENPTEGENTIMGKMAAVVAGARYTFDMDKTGKIYDVKDVNNSIGKITETAQDHESAPTVNLFAEMLGATKMSEAFNRTFVQFPNHALKVGDSWKKSDSYPAGPLGEMKIEDTFSLVESVGQESAQKIDVRSTIVINPSSEASSQGSGMDFKMQKSQSVGSFLFSQVNGRLLKQSAEMKMTVEAKGISMLISTEQKTVMELLP